MSSSDLNSTPTRSMEYRPAGESLAQGTRRRLLGGAAVWNLGPCFLALGLVLLAGCSTPIGVERATTRQAYARQDDLALRTGRPGASTVLVLHRYNLQKLAARDPEEAVRRLHETALATGERDVLFALAELSHVAGEHVRHSVKPWEPREARDYYLGSAVYAWLFLFGEGKQAPPGAFDRRFRDACDLYNHDLGLALAEGQGTNRVVRLADSRRRLPVGEIDLKPGPAGMGARVGEFDQLLLADQFRVRGLSVDSRQPGLGVPLIGVGPVDPQIGVRLAAPVSAVLQLPRSLAAATGGGGSGSLEVYSSFETTMVQVAGQEVPLEADLTAHRAYLLEHSRVWKLGKLQFLAPEAEVPSQLMLNQPFTPERIPVVFVHGTFSSPVTWAEMVNTLTADPVLRQRYQVWSFVYGSGNPLVKSVGEFRRALMEQVHQLDPHGTNALLRQMVVIGHSQGGLLVKGSVIDAGDRLWRVVSTRSLEETEVGEAERAKLRELLFIKPLPGVRRAVFIATPHRGSYLSVGPVRRLARRLLSLPATLVSTGREALKLTAGTAIGRFFDGQIPTSLDSMSPRNPGLLAMAEIPVAPGIHSHSIIPVQGRGDYRKGRDGVVAYESAHVEGVDSEFIVRSPHTCLNHPATIGEVRRILYEHLAGLE